jgi:hypothetical protein
MGELAYSLWTFRRVCGISERMWSFPRVYHMDIVPRRRTFAERLIDARTKVPSSKL